MIGAAHDARHVSASSGPALWPESPACGLEYLCLKWGSWRLLFSLVVSSVVSTSVSKIPNIHINHLLAIAASHCAVLLVLLITQLLTIRQIRPRHLLSRQTGAHPFSVIFTLKRACQIHYGLLEAVFLRNWLLHNHSLQHHVLHQDRMMSSLTSFKPIAVEKRYGPSPYHNDSER
jgi:hypothetical protein